MVRRGKGVDDLYTPEINSLIKNGGTVNGVELTGTLKLCDGTTNLLPLSKISDYTTCEPSVMAYDDVKVQAVINEIDGKTSDGTGAAPVPTILGMNFQEASVGQKLAVGGYKDAAGTPTALLAGAIAHVDASLGKPCESHELCHRRPVLAQSRTTPPSLESTMHSVQNRSAVADSPMRTASFVAILASRGQTTMASLRAFSTVGCACSDDRRCTARSDEPTASAKA